MSKNANIGELRTLIKVKKIVRINNSNGIPVEDEVDVFAGYPVYCKWVNAHSNEIWDAMQLQLRDPATITLRYSSILDDITLIIYRGDDPHPYEVISIDNVEQRNVWLEIKVQRRQGAR